MQIFVIIANYWTRTHPTLGIYLLKVNNSNTRTRWTTLEQLWSYFTPYSTASIVNFEHVIASWAARFNEVIHIHIWTLGDGGQYSFHVSPSFFYFCVTPYLLKAAIFSTLTVLLFYPYLVDSLLVLWNRSTLIQIPCQSNSFTNWALLWVLCLIWWEGKIIRSFNVIFEKRTDFHPLLNGTMLHPQLLLVKDLEKITQFVFYLPLLATLMILN